VGQKKPNGFGLFDTAGNAYEWCREWYAPYAPGPVTNPEELRSTLSDKPRRVLRGGSWLKDVANARSAARYRNTPGSRNADNGFRVVAATAPATPAPPPSATATRRAPVPPVGVVSRGGDFAGMLWSVLCGAGGLVALIYAIFRLAGRRHWKGAGYPGITAKLADDGVWFDVPRGLRGHGIQYRAVVGAGVYTWEATADGGRQYVYTGGRPSSVEVLAVVPPGQSASLVPAPPSRPAPAQRIDDDDDDSSGFRGYPSAY